MNMLKEFFLILTCLFTLLSITSCSDEEVDNTIPKENNLIEFSINSITSNVNFENMPLFNEKSSQISTRSYTDEKRYVIQIYHGSPYAYGVFNDISQAKVLLENGKSYSIEMAYYPNGHTLPYFSGTENQITNKFIYSIENKIHPNGSFSDGKGFIYFIPSVKYENIIGFDASEQDKIIDINLKPCVFALEFNITNLTSGIVKVKAGDPFNRMAELSFSPTNTHYESIYCHSNSISMVNAFKYTPIVQITYTNDSGIETGLFGGTIPTEMLKKTIVNINVPSPNVDASSSINVTLEEFTITDGQTINF